MREVTVPRDLEMMRGYDGKTTKTNMTNEYSFEFGVSGEFSSQLDYAAKVLYEALSEKSQDNEREQDLLAEITNYFTNCLLLDDKMIWEFVEQQYKNTNYSDGSFSDKYKGEH